MAVCDRCKTIVDYAIDRPITEVAADAPALITEMKRRAMVEQDAELAAFVGVGPSTVSKWRARCAVPVAVLLRFDRRLKAGHAAGRMDVGFLQKNLRRLQV